MGVGDIAPLVPLFLFFRVSVASSNGRGTLLTVLETGCPIYLNGNLTSAHRDYGPRFASHSSTLEIGNEKKDLDLIDRHNFSDFASHLHTGRESPVRDLREADNRFLQSIFGETILFRELSLRRFAQMCCLRQTDSEIHSTHWRS